MHGTYGEALSEVAIDSKLADLGFDSLMFVELRDYLSEPKETLMKAEFAKLPSTDVLEDSLNEFQENDRSLRSKRKGSKISEEEIEKANSRR